MFERDLEQRYGEHASVYEQIVTEAESSFKLRTGKDPTIFHKILIDKVADAYVCSLMLETDDQADKRKIKAYASELQKWLTLSMNEMKSVQAELEARQAFYRRVVDAITEKIPDVGHRKAVLLAIRSIVEE